MESNTTLNNALGLIPPNPLKANNDPTSRQSHLHIRKKREGIKKQMKNFQMLELRKRGEEAFNPLQKESLYSIHPLKRMANTLRKSTHNGLDCKAPLLVGHTRSLFTSQIEKSPFISLFLSIFCIQGNWTLVPATCWYLIHIKHVSNFDHRNKSGPFSWNIIYL